MSIKKELMKKKKELMKYIMWSESHSVMSNSL